MPHVLLSNDDGVHAEGLHVLHDAICQHASRIRVVAPDRNKSGASSSLSLSYPLSLKQLDNGFYSVDGTPADCVYLGVSAIWPDTPDLVISGINHGANLGDDVLYSGTVAAAREGRALGRPAIAISLVGDTHFDTAGKVAAMLLDSIDTVSLPPRALLNVNVPDVPWSEIKGIRITRLGRRQDNSSRPIAVKDPRGETRYWIGPVGRYVDEGNDTDFNAIEEGYVSITPLASDVTQYSALEGVNLWLDSLVRR